MDIGFHGMTTLSCVVSTFVSLRASAGDGGALLKITLCFRRRQSEASSASVKVSEEQEMIRLNTQRPPLLLALLEKMRKWGAKKICRFVN